MAVVAALLMPQPWTGIITAEAGTVETTDSQLPTGREGTASVFDGTYVWVFGGREAGKRLADIVRFNPETGVVTKTSTLKLPSVREFPSAVFDGTHAYILGGRTGGGNPDTTGNTLTEIVRFTPSTGTVQTMAQRLPEAVQRTSAVFDGRFIFLFGGLNSGAHDEVVRIDPTGAFPVSVVANLPSARSDTSAVFDGRYAWIFGGLLASGAPTDQILRFDPLTNAVTIAGAKLSTPRGATSALWDGDFAYIFGGRETTLRLNQILRFNPATDEIQVLAAKFDTERERTSAAFDGVDGWVIGGRNDGHRLKDFVRFHVDGDAPQNLRAASGPGFGQLSLEWEPPPAGSFESPILGYRIYRGETASSIEFYTVQQSADDTTFTDAGLPDGVTRHYQVSAFSADGEGGLSNPASASTFPTEPVDLPHCLQDMNVNWLDGQGAAYLFGGEQQNCGSDNGALGGSLLLPPGFTQKDDDEEEDSIIRYDPESGEVTILGVAPDKCCFFSEEGSGPSGGAEDMDQDGLGLIDGVYLFGGDGDEKCCDDDAAEGPAVDDVDGVPSDIFFFNPDTNTVSEVAGDLPNPACDLIGFSDGDLIYLIAVACGGGLQCCEDDAVSSTDDQGVGIGDIWIFDPATGLVEDTGNVLPDPRCCAFAEYSSVTGLGYLFGVHSVGSEPAPPGTLSDDESCDVYVLNPDTGIVVTLDPCIELPRCCFDGDEGGGGITLFGGGEDEDKCCDDEDTATADAHGGVHPLDEILVFDPATNTLRTAVDTLDQELAAAGAQWTGQRFLIWGGFDGTQSVADVEAFDPKAPQGLRATGGHGTISLAWHEPLEAWAFTHYKVYRQAEDGSQELLGVVEASTRTFVDDGLPDGATRTYRVSATDGTNEGPQSKPATAKTFELPGAPTLQASIQGSESGAQVVLEWSAPESDGGTPITAYHLYRGLDGAERTLYAETSADARSFTDEECDLQEHVCAYSVAAANALGEGPHSNVVVADADVPSAPQNLEATFPPEIGVVHLSWDPPQSSGGLEITEYVIYRRTELEPQAEIARVAGTETTYDDEDCDFEIVQCYYQVSAVNFVGEGPKSEEEAAILPDEATTGGPLGVPTWLDGAEQRHSWDAARHF